MKLEPVAWMDDFGNAFPLAANKGAGSWRDEHKRNWKPLYAIPEGYVVVPVEVTDKIPQWLLDAIDRYAAVADDDTAAMEARAFAVRKLREWQALIAAKEQS